MLGDEELRRVFEEVTAECGCTVKGFRAIVAAGLRKAIEQANVSAESLQAIANEYDALNNQPPVPWEEWHAQRAEEDAAAAASSVREIVVEGRVVQLEDTPEADKQPLTLAAQPPKEAV